MEQSEPTSKERFLPELALWWKKSVVYQIYPRSFFDSNGDGIGDLQGIISKLDYVKSLGIDTVWMSPFYASPQRDFGYDISDYMSIAPEYGTMDIVDTLIEEIHKRELKLVLDMVLNHTSDQHPWFLTSKESRTNEFSDWYVWKEGKNKDGKAPPNNWVSLTGGFSIFLIHLQGSSWHYVPSRNEWYLAQYLDFQPDLNYRNPKVKQTMFDIMRYWVLKKGVDGFRLDMINAIYEDPQFRDNPFAFQFFPNEETAEAFFQKSLYTFNQSESFQFARELRALLDEFKPYRFLVGEVCGAFEFEESNVSKGPAETLRNYCSEKPPYGLDTVFLFKTLDKELKANIFRDLIKEYQQYFFEPLIPTWVFSNHDNFRRISRFGNGEFTIAKAKLNAAFQLTVRGIPFIYYGEEIGMTQLLKNCDIPIEKGLDAQAIKYKWVPNIFIKAIRSLRNYCINRDECRTPMQWNSSPNGGFCASNVNPWLPVNSDFKERNVEAQESNEDSLLHCYKRFLKIRRENEALNCGDIKIIDSGDFPQEKVLVYERRTVNQKLFVVLNFTNKNLDVINGFGESAQILVSTTCHFKVIQNNVISLGPFEGVIIK